MKALTCITVAYFVSTFMTSCHVTATSPRPAELPKHFPKPFQSSVDVHSKNLYNAVVDIFESHFDEKLKDLKNDMKSFVNENLEKTKKLIDAKSKDSEAYVNSEVQGLDGKFEKLLRAESKNIRGFIKSSLIDLKDQMQKKNEEITKMEQKNTELLERLKGNDEILMMMNHDHISCVENTCFILVDNPATWMEANATCHRYGGFLSEVRTSDQADHISKLTTKIKSTSALGAWLGGNDRVKEGEWQWQKSGDKIPLRGETGFQLWRPTDPDNAHGNQDCLRQTMTSVGGRTWDDISCREKLASICQRPKQ